MSNEDLGVKVDIKVPFSVIKETLERIGIVNNETKKIYPSCYIVEEIVEGKVEHKIYHFKELFIKEGKQSSFFDKNDDKDLYRRNTIIYLLQEWGLIKVLSNNVEGILVEKIDVVSHKMKHLYKICHKYLFKNNIKL